MAGIHRRPSGIYFARLVVPKRLRPLVGQSELIASTGVRDLALARIVAGQIIVGWRERLLELDGLKDSAGVDLQKLTLGAPELLAERHLPLIRASAVSGMPEDLLLREAAEGRIHLYIRLAGLPGYRIPVDALERDSAPDGSPSGFVVPNSSQMPPSASSMACTGVFGLLEPRLAAELALARQSWVVVAVASQGDSRHIVAPDEPLEVSRLDLHVLGSQVDATRRRISAAATPDQISAARGLVSSAAAVISANRQRVLSESITDYLKDHPRLRREDETRRVRASCELFLELMGAKLRGCDLTIDLIRQFRDNSLPKVPANENLIRMKHGTSSVSESIKAVDGTDWPSLSPGQQVKHLKWICDWMDWLGENQWANRELTVSVKRGGDARRSVAKSKQGRTDRERRDSFTDEQLAMIFSAPWFRDGHGALTQQGTYREWLPYRYWLPLLGAYTGARINELSQISLEDIKLTGSGIGLIRIEGDVGDVPTGAKRVKTANSRRTVPVHPRLIELGLMSYAQRLQATGHNRLFPELSADRVKGYGKRPTQWFSAYLEKLGLPRDGKLVFHSFRHTLSIRLGRLPNIRQSLVAEILGHERGESMAEAVYNQDEREFGPGSPIVQAISAVNYSFAEGVAPFNIAEGLKAVGDALKRKDRARPQGRRVAPKV